MSAVEAQIRQIAPRFLRQPERCRVAACVRHGEGLIHASFRVTLETPEGRRQWLVQRVNTHVLRDVARVQDNLVRVTDHLRTKLGHLEPEELARRVLSPVFAPSGESVLRDDEGQPYRAFVFIDRAHALHAAPTEVQALEAGRAFGAFSLALVDLPPPALHETIPGFHDSVARLQALRAAAAADRLGRARDAQAELESITSREPLALEVAAALACGDIPRRIAHNDTKLDNLLFDDQTGRALCVLDLDTTMPGSWLHDFGDLARSLFTPHGVRLPLLAALARGYLAEVGAQLGAAERRFMPEAPRLLALELAARFLSDHLEGDRYFAAALPGENLERARAQLALVLELERHAETIRTLVKIP